MLVTPTHSAPCALLYSSARSVSAVSPDWDRKKHVSSLAAARGMRVRFSLGWYLQPPAFRAPPFKLVAESLRLHMNR